MSKYIWKIKSKTVLKKNKNWLLNTLAQNRNLKTKKDLDRFLNPSLEDILKVELRDLDKGKKRVLKAIKDKEKMVVYSDYDADGICASAIMWETLYNLGADVLPYVPHRLTEGYGLSNGAIKKLAEEKVKLIITVDHGVTAVEQIEYAKSLGVEVVVTDHHVLPDKLPSPAAIVHTTDLCGAGVAWLFCWEIIKKANPSYKKNLEEKLELAALATIADLVPLIGANRAIVKIGLEKISNTKRPGIKALIKNSNVNRSVGTYEIGHILAPRINAMGRIEHGLDALRLLCSKDQEKANNLADLLSRTNTKRQGLTTKAVDHAISIYKDESVIGVVSHESWHEGVIGLVASRLVEAHYRPMVVISKGEKYSKGSARSIAGFNIVEAIRESSEFLVDGGGHPMAAGFTIETKHIELFKEKITKYARSKITEDILSPKLEIECQLKKEDITGENLSVIENFEPFGTANPRPLFLLKNALVEDMRTVGSLGKHLKLQLDGLEAIGFFLGDFQSQIRPGYKIDVVFSLEKNNYNGQNNIQLKIKDLDISEKSL